MKQLSADSEDRDNHQLNLRVKLHQDSIVKHVEKISWETGSEAPIVVELDPTSACNLACPDCISRDLLNQGFFSREKLREIVEEIVNIGVKAVILIGGGEPLAHPEVGWAIDYLGNNDVQVGITTNGLLINRYIEPIAKHADWVRVSMDAGTAETFQLIRPSRSGKSQFNKALENMKMLSAIKKGKLGYSFMIYSDGGFENDPSKATHEVIDNDGTISNVAEIYQAAVLAKSVGCNYFELKQMYDINHYSIILEDYVKQEVKVQIAKCKTLEDNNFRILLATKLPELLNGSNNIETKEYSRCAVSELRTLITPSGVYVCPYFRGNTSKKIGDLKTTSITDMWRSSSRNDVMNALDPSQDCKMHCIRHQSNLELERMIGAGSLGDTIDDFDFFI